jgi:dipeptidyl aminopeptidase/acylaminoacyl peptidase
MTEKRIAPYGSWASPITSDLIVSDTIKLIELAIDGEDVFWVEMRPTEAGRYVLVRRTRAGTVDEVTPESFSVRTRVHEYGGGAFVVNDGFVFFSNFADQRLYQHERGKEPMPITPATDLRYADGVFDHRHNRLICVREDHTAPENEPINSLVSKKVDDDGGGDSIVSGRDFYASPRLSPDGTKLVWLEWDHPNMPWDGTELCVADVATDGSLGETKLIAGGPKESVLQPEWSPDGVLYYLSDCSGWWNLYRWTGGNTEPLCPKEAEFGYPMWTFGRSSYGFQSSDSLICTFIEDGSQHLARLDTRTLELHLIATPYSSFSNLRVGPTFAVFIAGSPTKPAVIARLDLNTNDIEILHRASTVDIDDGYLSVPQAITFPTEHGLTAHAYHYSPKNRGFNASDDEFPPLLVKSHGGPTGATSSNFNLEFQYWTSRGFAVLDVNYGGSTGYGRAYRDRLRGQWGVIDVDDCVNGALYLVDQRLADQNRLAIDGGSAGGYTTLNALTFRDVFKAGASHYGISDLMVFVGDTHKFESRYLDSLIGPYPQRQDLYEERSAINYVDQLSCPVIFFQGDEDKIVPPNQAELMVEALRQKGLPVAYLLFGGEQHGFRKSQNIKRALDAELYFYSRVFGFEPADDIEPVEIDNLRGE